MARCTGLVTVFCIEEWISNPEMLTTGIHPPEGLDAAVINTIVSRMKAENISIFKEIIN